MRTYRCRFIATELFAFELLKKEYNAHEGAKNYFSNVVGSPCVLKCYKLT